MGAMYAQPGEIDKTFNLQLGVGFDKKVERIAVQADGKILVTGIFTNYGFTVKKSIIRLNSDGTIDATFSTGTGAEFINDIAIQTDGKIIIAGGFKTFNDVAVNRIARLNTDGTIDTSFNSGIGSNSYSCILIQADGKILIGGFFTSYDGVERKNLARLNADGFLDTTFNPGSGTSGTIRKMGLLASGKIIIMGDFDSYNGTNRERLAQINDDGALDSTFNPGTGISSLQCLAVQDDGKVVIGGYFAKYNNITKKAIVRLNLDGTLDNTFNFNIEASATFSSLQMLANGKVLGGGKFNSLDKTAERNLIRINTDGTVDETFKSGTKEDSHVACIALKADGKILIGGEFTTYNDIAIGRFAQLVSEGTLDTNFFNPPGFALGANNTIVSMTLQPDGKIIVAGAFTAFNSGGIIGSFRLNPEGTFDNLFRPQTTDVSLGGAVEFCVIVQPDGKSLLAGRHVNVEGQLSAFFGRWNNDGSVDETFKKGKGLGSNGEVTTIALQNDKKILIAGRFTKYFDEIKNGLVRLNEDGTIDATFNIGTGVDFLINSIVVQADGKVLIAGQFTTYNGVARNKIARLNADGTLDASFKMGTGFNGLVNSLALQLDGKIIVGGSFSSYDNNKALAIARLNPDGSLDSDFSSGTGFNDAVKTIKVAADGKIVVGGNFSFFNGIERKKIVQLNPDGTLDTNFDPGTGANGLIRDLLIQADGNILIAGDFTTYNGISVGRIARILSTNNALSTEVFNQSKLIVYPNPSTGIFNVQFNQSKENASIIIFDLNGRIVHQSKAENLDNKPLDIHHLQNGIYILNVKNATYNYSQKIVKK